MDYEDDANDKFNLLNQYLSKVDKDTVIKSNKKKNKCLRFLNIAYQLA